MNREHDELETPWRYGKWLIWPRTILSHIEISDCNDTIEGICYKGKTIYDCMNACPENTCGAGTYVKFRSGKSICAPLRTIIHPNLSPTYQLKNQTYYGLDPKKVDVSVFINTEIFPFPPKLSKVVFYGEILSVTDKKTDKVMDTKKIIEKGEGPCIFDKSGVSTISLLPLFRTDNPLTHNRPVLYGDRCMITISSTSYVLRPKDNRLYWEASLDAENTISNAFNFRPLSDEKNMGDFIEYTDDMLLDYRGLGIVSVNEDGDLYLSRKSDDVNRIVFNLVSRMNGYYCDNGICKTIPIKDASDKEIYNHRLCWNLCGRDMVFPTSPPPFVWERNRRFWLAAICIVFTILMVIILIRIFYARYSPGE